MLAMRAAMMISPVGSLIGNSNKKARKMLMVEEEERFGNMRTILPEKKRIFVPLEKSKEKSRIRRILRRKSIETILNKMSTSLWERTATDSDFTSQDGSRVCPSLRRGKASYGCQRFSYGKG